jgi:hypothetical protein
MGMFDTLHYEDKEYQTKDFECIMETYRIVNKRLLKDEYHYEEVPKEQRPYPDGKGILKMCGCVKKVIDKKDVDVEYHGIFEAHYIDNNKNFHSELFKFTDGNLVEVIKQDE